MLKQFDYCHLIMMKNKDLYINLTIVFLIYVSIGIKCLKVWIEIIIYWGANYKSFIGRFLYGLQRFFKIFGPWKNDSTEKVLIIIKLKLTSNEHFTRLFSLSLNYTNYIFYLYIHILFFIIAYKTLFIRYLINNKFFDFYFHYQAFE